MNVTLDYLRGRRVWLVRNLCVWGEYSTTEFFLIQTELGGSFKRVIFNQLDFNSRAQVVSFDSLYDFKGNNLPQSINSPKVIALPKNETFCVIIDETNTGFKIAMKGDSVEKGLVDLLILELG